MAKETQDKIRRQQPNERKILNSTHQIKVSYLGYTKYLQGLITKPKDPIKNEADN